MNAILSMLTGGDLRSEGRATEVATEVLAHPDRLSLLVEGLNSDSNLIRARTCMSFEVLSQDRPDLLTPLLPHLIDLAARETLPQARWHLAEILSRAVLSDAEAERAVAVLLSYLSDKSKIVRYCAVDALGLLGAQAGCRDEIVTTISAMRGVTKSLDRAIANALCALGPAQE